MTNQLQLSEMADDAVSDPASSVRPISVRLDDESERALAWLMEHGSTQSEAIRRALVDAARAARREQIRADIERVNADERDRAELAAVSDLMDSLAAPW